jgi:N-acetyl-alpha-D-muramate 1-phosphate uridylyltransferase
MVLAAGLGQRMRPLTIDRPKPLVSFCGRPLLDHVLDRIAGAGIEKAVVNAHYLADQIDDYAKNRKPPPSLTVSDERDSRLDTGGGVKRALPLLGADPFLIHNSDSIWHDTDQDNLQALFAAWNTETMDTLLLLAKPQMSIGYGGSGDFVMSADATLSRSKSASPNALVFTGVSIAHPRLFDDAPADDTFSLNVLWDRAITRGRVAGHVLDGTWMHLGTPDALSSAEHWIANAET